MGFWDYINPYCWVTDIRNFAFDKGWLKSSFFHLPVVSVGNLTVGGTGKTPHIEYIINLLKEEYHIATLSRGYKRASKGYVKATSGCDTSIIGDEPAQIKSKFPDITVAVDEKRVDGIEHLLSEEKQPDVILLDDAFQHRYVTPGLSIVLVDSNRPIWNDNVLPFGRLRERADGIKRADVIVVTKCPQTMQESQKQQFRQKLGQKNETPVFFSTVCYDNPKALFDVAEQQCTIGKGTNVLLLTGIARPEPLKKELESRGAEVTLMQFADHHNFSRAELDNVAKKFASLPSDNKTIITTEKDAERITGRNDLPYIIKEKCYSLPIKVRIMDEEKMFNQIIIDYVRKNQRDRSVSAVSDEDKA